MIVGSVLLVVFNFASRVIVARTVSLPKWRAYNLVLAFTSVLSTVALVGLPNAIARTLAYEPEPTMQRRTIEVGVLLAVAISFVVSATIFVFATPLATLFQASATGLLTLTLQALV